MANAQYDDWSNLLFRLQAAASPAELQGMLCGRLCGGQRLEPEEWLRSAVEFLDLVDPEPDVALDEAARRELTALYIESLADLEEPARPLELLLPPDELSLQQRLEALADWCQGFLHGVGASGLQGEQQLEPEVAEALRDMAQISQAEVDEEESEENEHHYTELVEYVRVAVLTLFSEFNASRPQVH